MNRFESGRLVHSLPTLTQLTNTGGQNGPGILKRVKAAEFAALRHFAFNGTEMWIFRPEARSWRCGRTAPRSPERIGHYLEGRVTPYLG